MARTPLVVGNWKMELSHKAAVETARAIKKLLSPIDLSTQVVLCPSYPSLPEVSAIFKNSEKVDVGAQHVHHEEKGPLTGSVSVSQISPFARWCIVGHSEQRALVNLQEEQVRDSAALLLRHGITPVVCIGETAEERAREETVAKVTQQMQILLSGMTRIALSKLVIAYEPIWAISSQSSGEMPEPGAVAEIILLIRKLTAARFDGDVTEKLRVIYGGSVKSDNVEAYIQEPGVDGVLAGSASTAPLQLVEIVKILQKNSQQ